MNQNNQVNNDENLYMIDDDGQIVMVPKTTPPPVQNLQVNIAQTQPLMSPSVQTAGNKMYTTTNFQKNNQVQLTNKPQVVYQQPQPQPQPQQVQRIQGFSPQVNNQESLSLSYENWKKMNMNFGQMVTNQNQMQQYNEEPVQNVNQQLNTDNNTKYTSNRAINGSYISNNASVYNNYTVNKPDLVKSVFAIRKSRNSESSFL